MEENKKQFIHQGKNLQLIDFPAKRVKILMTEGLSKINLKLPENANQLSNIELYFCLPSYWDIENASHNFQWPKDWLVKLWNHIETKQTWLGHGHTILCSPDYAPISENMKQNHFFVVSPILLEEELSISVTEKLGYQCFGILPIYGEEMDFKQGKGTYKLLKKLVQKGNSEKLDDYRVSVLQGRMRLFR